MAEALTEDQYWATLRDQSKAVAEKLRTIVNAMPEPLDAKVDALTRLALSFAIATHKTDPKLTRFLRNVFVIAMTETMGNAPELAINQTIPTSHGEYVARCGSLRDRICDTISMQEASAAIVVDVLVDRLGQLIAKPCGVPMNELVDQVSDSLGERIRYYREQGQQTTKTSS